MSTHYIAGQFPNFIKLMIKHSFNWASEISGWNNLIVSSFTKNNNCCTSSWENRWKVDVNYVCGVVRVQLHRAEGEAVRPGGSIQRWSTINMWGRSFMLFVFTITINLLHCLLWWDPPTHRWIYKDENITVCNSCSIDHPLVTVDLLLM